MAKVKGMVVEIGGDTSGLLNAIKYAQKQLRGLGTEMADVNKLLKVNPTNFELLGQKQSLINTQLTRMRGNLIGLEKAQQNFIKSGGDLNSKEYRKLQRYIEQTKQKIKELEKVNASSWYAQGQKLIDTSDKWTKWGEKVASVGKKLTRNVTIPIVAIGTLSAKSAIEFETAFTGVEKTVDGTAEQMEKLKNGIKQLSKVIPASTTEISKVAELAGQLGIQTDNILDFTEVMIRLGTSTNLSAEEASSALAKFANVTKMSAKDYQRLGSVIVDLGNNYATTEADIVNMGTRLGSVTAQLGISQAKTMGLATALSSVGIESEVGATAMTKLLKKLQVAVETGGDELNQFAKVSGMTAKEFKKAYQEDATKALVAFIKGLNDTKRNGKSAVSVLQDMKIKEVRLSNAILGLANNTDLLTSALEDSEKAWDANSALLKESKKRYDTMQSKIDMLKNRLQLIAMTIGEKLMPYIEKFVNWIGDLTEKFEGLDESTQKSIINFASFVAIIGPAVTTVGKVVSTIGNLTSGIGNAMQVMAKFAITTNGLGPAFIAVGAIIAGFTAQIIEFEQQKDRLNNVAEGFGNLSKRVDEAKSRLPELNKAFGKAFSTEDIQKKSQDIQSKITEIFDTASKERRKLTQKEIDKIDEYFKQLDALSSKQLEVERARSQAIYESQKSELETYQGNLEGYKTLGAQLIATQKDQSNKEIEIAKTNAIEKITLKQQELANTKMTEEQRKNVLDQYTKEVNAIRDREIQESRKKVGDLQSVYNEGYNKISSTNGGFLEKTKNFLKDREQRENYHAEQIRKIKNHELWYVTDEQGQLIRENENFNRMSKAQTQEYLKNLDKKGREELGEWLESLATTEMYGGKITKEDEKIAKEVLEAYDELPADVKEQFKDTMQGAWNGLNEKESSLLNKASEIAGSITNTIAKVLQIHSPSRVTYKQGQNTAQGMINGLQSKKKLVGKTASEIAEIIVNSAEKRLERIKITQEVSLKYEEGYWKKILNKVKKGTDAYYEALQKYTDAHQAVNDKKQELLEKSEELTKDFTDNVLKIEEDFTTQSQSLWDEYYDKVNSRAKQIAEAFSIFDEVKLDEAISGTQIISNLETQIATIEDYDSTLTLLQDRLKSLTGDEGDNLFQFLQEQGVKSLDQLKEITTMTDDELKNLVALYNRKEDIALQQAQREYKALYEETISAIGQLRDTADKQVEALRQQYIKDLRQVAQDGKKEGINVGTQITRGIKNGLDAGMDQVEAELKARVKALTDSVKSQLKIASPSKVYEKEIGQMMALGLGEGFINKINSLTAQMSNAVIKQASMISGNIPTIDGKIPTSNAITINFYPQEMTEAELEKAFDYVNRRFGIAY